MEQLHGQRIGRVAALAIILAGIPFGKVSAQMLSLDNFDEYNATNYIQGPSNSLATAQQGTNGKFQRFGSAVSDGLYSSAAAGNGGGTGNRGAVANAAFSSAATQYLPALTFTSAFNLSSTGSTTITLDIKVGTTATPNLNAFVQIQDASGEQYQSSGIAIGAATTYQTFSFNFAPGAVTVTANPVPTDTLANVLANATRMNILFSDTADTASQAISFDNLSCATAAVPEPSTWVMGALLTAAFAVRRLRRLAR